MGGTWDSVKDFLLLLLLGSGSQEEWCKYLLGKGKRRG